MILVGKNPRILFLLLLQLAVSACSTLVRVPDADYDLETEPPIEAYARVLKKYVNDAGEVDFSALAQDRAGLDRYVAYIARTPGSGFADPQARLAHYLNSYNALSMYNVLELGIPETHAGWRKIRFFWLRDFVIGGTGLSLYAYENEVIRKLGDPRVHFALNCSALGCPVLPRIPFNGPTLHQELEREARKFFSEGRNLHIDHAQKKVYLSAILRFYTEDFTPIYAPSLIAYVNRYVADPIPEDYTVEFIDYDWTIANTRRARPVAAASLRPPMVSGPQATGTPRQEHVRSAPARARW